MALILLVSINPVALVMEAVENPEGIPIHLKFNYEMENRLLKLEDGSKE